MPRKKQPTEEETVSYEERVQNAIRYWTVNGDPIKARDINRALANKEEVPAHLLNLTRYRPVTEVDMDEIEIPSRTGRGSGLEKWQDFARATSDMDEDVLKTMTKEDIIAALEANGIVPAEEEEVE